MKKILISIGLCFGMMQVGFAAQNLDKIVAIVNDDVLTQTTLNQQMDIIKKQLQNNAQMPSDEQLTKQVLQRLIDVTLQVQLAKDNNIEVTDPELDAAIKQIAKKNHFSVSQLKQNLKSEGIAFKDYKDNIRKEMLMNQVQRRAVAQKITISPEEIDSFLKLNKSAEKQNTKYHVKDILIAVSDEPSSEELTAAKKNAQKLVKELRAGRDFSSAAVAESNSQIALNGGDLGWRAIYEYPSVFSKQLRNMKKGDVAGPIKTANGYHIIKLVEKRGDSQKHFAQQTHVRHILLKKDALTTDNEIKAKLNKIRKLILKHNNFAAVAKKVSQDPVSGSKGGDLGWVDPGQTVPAFENNMNHLALHKLSKPIHSPYGWHLIEVLGRRKVDATKKLEKAKAQEILFQQKLQVQLQGWLQALRAQSYIKVMADA